MVKAILYDYRGDVKQYILVEPYKEGFHFAFGVTHNEKVTFQTKWSTDYYRTENNAILAANEMLGKVRHSRKIIVAD